MPKTLEAEIIEIDGKPVSDNSQKSTYARKGRIARQIEQFFDRFRKKLRTPQGRVITLNRNWWPLWVLLGVLGGIVLLFIAGITILLSAVVLVLRSIFRLFLPASQCSVHNIQPRC